MSRIEAHGIDYALTPAEAGTLENAAALPADLRARVIRAYAAMHGTEALVRLFAEFMGLANSVVANNREMIELELVIEGVLHPERSHQINLPTISGALRVVGLAHGVSVEKACAGCAYRLATPANQSPVTTCDATYCVEHAYGMQDFMCHEDLDAKGQPQHLCIGFAQQRKSRARFAVAGDAA